MKSLLHSRSNSTSTLFLAGGKRISRSMASSSASSTLSETRRPRKMVKLTKSKWWSRWLSCQTATGTRVKTLVTMPSQRQGLTGRSKKMCKPIRAKTSIMTWVSLTPKALNRHPGTGIADSLMSSCNQGYSRTVTEGRGQLSEHKRGKHSRVRKTSAYGKD